MNAHQLMYCHCSVAFAYTNKRGDVHRYVAVAFPLADGNVIARVVWRDGEPRSHPMRVPLSAMVGLHIATPADFN